jgi:hypothetical protein
MVRANGRECSKVDEDLQDLLKKARCFLFEPGFVGFLGF